MRHEFCVGGCGRLGSGRLGWDRRIGHDGKEGLSCHNTPHTVSNEDRVDRGVDGGRGCRGSDLEVDDFVLEPAEYYN